MKSLWAKWFGPKYYLAPPGYDPTVDPLPDGLSNRRGGGGGAGLGTWLQIGLMVLGLAGVIGFSIYKIVTPVSAATLPASATPTLTATATALGSALPPSTAAAGAPVSQPTRTPLVWPTIGVLRVTEATGRAAEATHPRPTAAEREGAATSWPTPAPSQTARVIYQPAPTVVVYVTEPPQATYTPLPTYTALPTYTEVPATATVTNTPEPTATCPAPALPDPAFPESAAYVLYLPLVQLQFDQLTVTAGCP